MRLIKPSPGEAADRQVILELKMKYGGTEVPVDTTEPEEPPKEITKVKNEGGIATTIARQRFVSGKVNIQHFIDEHSLIQAYLENHWFPSLITQIGADIEFDRLYEELAEVNALIWKLTDRGHVLVTAAKSNKDGAGMLAMSDVMVGTIEQNDIRADLVRRINELFGLKVQEKIFP